MASSKEQQSQPPAPTAATTQEPLQTCRCGHNRNHAMVTGERSYSFIGWIALLVGVTAIPTKIEFRCSKCTQTFEASTDADICEMYGGTAPPGEPG